MILIFRRPRPPERQHIGLISEHSAGIEPIFAAAYQRKVISPENLYPLVIHIASLGGGQGIIIAQDADQALDALRDILDREVFGRCKLTIEPLHQ